VHPARDEVEPFVNGWIDHFGVRRLDGAL
jgi:hypothetical protein